MEPTDNYHSITSCYSAAPLAFGHTTDSVMSWPPFLDSLQPHQLFTLLTTMAAYNHTYSLKAASTLLADSTAHSVFTWNIAKNNRQHTNIKPKEFTYTSPTTQLKFDHTLNESRTSPQRSRQHSHPTHWIQAWHRNSQANVHSQPCSCLVRSAEQPAEHFTIMPSHINTQSLELRDKASWPCSTSYNMLNLEHVYYVHNHPTLLWYTQMHSTPSMGRTNGVQNWHQKTYNRRTKTCPTVGALWYSHQIEHPSSPADTYHQNFYNNAQAPRNLFTS